ncbi:hypothetical protein [Segeticoccus rhizosphaerae]|uniref:hypothetical protein n=1 Tax=Segeticoccus rhizosphaerae TaxID=1104777 RepID=UPI001396879A|nr:hypothetical protein [Segeticoccus rhizosphaerae]
MSPRVGRPECDGAVATLNGQLILFTGKSRVEGKATVRDQLFALVRDRGGQPISGTRNARITVLVLGELLPEVVTDPVSVRSKNLVYVEDQRRSGNHICIVDDSGITALLKGSPAPCLRSRSVPDDLIEVRRRGVDEVNRPRLVPLTIGAAPAHEPTGLEIDLIGLDRGTAAHQTTLRTLVSYLRPTEAMALTLPRVDIAWISHAEAGVLCVAEVKSLTGRRQDQQLRLGIGQVLDYAHTLRENLPADVTEIRPILVLERRPDDHLRWGSVASSAGIALTWAPNFSSLVC